MAIEPDSLFDRAVNGARNFEKVGSSVAVEDAEGVLTEESSSSEHAQTINAPVKSIDAQMRLWRFILTS